MPLILLFFFVIWRASAFCRVHAVARRHNRVAPRKPHKVCLNDDDDDAAAAAAADPDARRKEERQLFFERENAPLTITFVTGNEKKLIEAQSIFDSECDIPFCLEPLGGLDLDELQSDEPEKIAAAKCRLAARVVGGPVMVDDTSLCFAALGGMPGPYIKWFMNTAGCDGLVRMLDGFDDRRAWAQCCIAFSPGPGAEPCVYTGKTYGHIAPTVGASSSASKWQSAGGFGWDAIFVPDWLPLSDGGRPQGRASGTATDDALLSRSARNNVQRRQVVAKDEDGLYADKVQATTVCSMQRNNNLNLTFADISANVKNKISHRARALRQLAIFLQENEEWVYGRARKRKNLPNPPSDLFSFRRRRRML